MQGTYLLCGIIIASLVIWPEETAATLTVVSLKIQVFYINYKMKLMAWNMHRQLSKASKAAGWPEPPPFRFVNIWDREQP